MKKLPIVFLFALLTALGGCLEIDGQDVTIRYDAAKDRIDILLVYRGIFAEGGSDDDPLEKALKDLEQARETGEFVLWNNWPLQVDLTVDRPAPIAALSAHVEVENGGLFTDPQGVLCGYQMVRINDAKAFVAKVNTLLELALQTGFGEPGLRGLEGRHMLDDDTKDILREFLRSGEKLFVCEPGRIELRLPFSQPDHAWIKAQIEDHLMDNMPREITRRAAVVARRADGRSVTDTSYADETVNINGAELRKQIEHAPSYRFFWDNDLSIVRELELTRIGIGVAGAEQLQINKSSEGLYHDAFLKHLREQEEKIEDGLPDQEIVRRFEAFRDRDVVLPPKLAKMRG